MKKYFLMVLIFSLAMAFACKRESKHSESEPPAAQVVSKCARYAVNVFKEQERTNRLTTLAKTERVDMLSTESITNDKGVTVEVAHIQLSDGSKGYLEARHLADRVVVFMQNTSAFQRNNTGSRVNATIPAGTLGFVIDEKDEWLQIYVGQIDGRWLTQDWVNGGFSTDEDLIADARFYEEALTVLRNKNSKASEKQAALKRLEGLRTSTLFSEKAEEQIAIFTAEPELEPEPVEPGSD